MEDSRKSKVLVLGDTLSALAVGRSLGRQGVYVIACVEDKNAPLRHSKYTRQVFVLPSYAGNPDKWRGSLKKIISEEKPDLVIPASESSFVPLCLNRDEFTGASDISIPDKNGFETTYFKDKTIALAKGLGIPVPNSFFIRNKDDFEEFFRMRPFGSLFVVKTIVSKIWQDGYKLEFSARGADTEEEVRRYVRDYLIFAPILIQQRFEGVGVGQEFLCKDGEVLMAFEHLRLTEPEGSGGSSYRKSVPLDERMLECSKKILKNLKWNGVAMVEYRKNLNTGDFVLLEINGRFWGSLPLAIASGADFPYALYRMMVCGEKNFPRKYKTEVYVRDLIDDLRFIAKSRGFFAAFINLLLAKARFLLGRDKWDAFTWGDPWPGIMEFWVVGSSLFSAITARASKTVYGAFYRYPSGEYIKKLLEKNRSILFVCLGNIARSPFAEKYLEKKLKEKGVFDVKTSSSGIYPKEHRLAHPYAKLAAEELGVDLLSHRSSILSDTAVSSYGIIFCMDLEEHRFIRKRFPSAKKKLLLLGYYGEQRGGIKDPWGGGPESYRVSYQIIKDIIDKLFSLKLIG